MEKKSFADFSDDETRRRLRHWFVSHPQATEADIPEALTVLDRLPSWRDVNAALEPFGRKSAGPPDHLADFVAQLAVARGAKRVLDPFAKSPTMIAALAEYLPTAQATALAPAEWTVETGRTVAPGVRWQGGDPPVSLALLDGPFDFIAATPPLGSRKGSFPIRSGLGEYSHSLMIDAGELLAPDGCLAVLVSDGFFFRADARRTRAALAELGLRVEAAISIEGGLRPASDLPVSLLIVTRGSPVDRLFVGRLDPAIDPSTLIENLSRRQEGRYLQLGVLYLEDDYRGWRALLNERELLLGLGGMRLPYCDLGEIAIGYARLSGDPGDGGGNSIYVPELPRAEVLIRAPEKVRGYTRVDLDPDRANARWVAAWLNEPLGQTARLAVASGATIERIVSRDLDRLKVALPPLEEQKKAIGLGQELQLIAGELSDMRADLYTGQFPLDQAARLLDGVRTSLVADGSPSSTAATAADWIELLPYPLASVGRRYLATQSAREKVEHLQHFFEGYGIFMATVLLSAARQDPQTYDEVKAKLRAKRKAGQSVLDRPSLHDWITLGRTVARAIGERLDTDTPGEVRVTLFGNLQPDLVDDFVTGEYWAAVDSARLVRNERSHGGIESEASLADRLARFEAALNDLRLQAAHPFASADLIRPGPAERGIDDLYTFDRAERLMGSNTTFDEREVKSTASMRGPGLYLVPAAGDVERPLHLLPLIRFHDLSGTNERPVFYYNRRSQATGDDQFRFVTYHFDPNPEEHVSDQSVAGLIEELTAT